MTVRPLPLFAGLGALLAGLLALSFLVGPMPVGAEALLRGLWQGGETPVALVAREIRLPRALLAALVGFALGVAGAALQGLLRNPLAEPGLVGASAAAALGAVLTIYFGVAATMPLAVPAAGIAGALAAVVLVRVLAGSDPGTLAMILSGVAVQSLAASLTALALNLAPNPHAALEIAFWLLGSLTDRTMDHLAVAAPFVAAGAALLLAQARALDALALGDRTAASLGVRLTRVRAALVLGTALSVGAAVSVTGAVGFVGLVVPHLVRPLVGHQPGRALLPSGLAGACLLLAADTLIRLLPTHDELRLGVVTGLIGAPFFLHLLATLRREMR